MRSFEIWKKKKRLRSLDDVNVTYVMYALEVLLMK